MRRKRKDFNVFSLSFLDVVCCGFGAVILLFVIALGSEVESEDPMPREDVFAFMAAARAEEIDRLAGEKEDLEKRLDEARALAQAASEELEAWEAELAAAREGLGEMKAAGARLLTDIEDIERRNRELAGQRQPPVLPQRPTIPLGIPVDRDHVVFVIDTSGSMRGGMFLLNVVIQKVRETIEAYPQIRRVQFLNADGVYLISGTEGRWIEDSPQIRQQFLNQLRSPPDSSSNPEGGIAEGIRLAQRLNDPQARIAIFVFGDEFDTNPDPAVRRINRMNQGTGVSISAIGFDQRVSPSLSSTGLRFVNFMRAVAQANDGAFVGVRAR
jgi:hypothetical protein